MVQTLGLDLQAAAGLIPGASRFIMGVMGSAKTDRGSPSWLKGHWRKLLAIGDTPESVGLGAALGILIGFTPLFGVKTLLSLALALAFRANKVATIVGLSLHELAFPFRPALYFLEFEIGWWLWHHAPHSVARATFGHIQLHDWFKWSTLRMVGGPTLLGSMIIGVPAALLTYWLTKATLAKRQSAPLINTPTGTRP